MAAVDADLNVADKIIEADKPSAFFHRWLNNLKGRVADLEAADTSLDTRVDTLETDVDALQAALPTGGSFTGTTSAGGQLTIPHGRASTPVGVTFNITSTSARSANFVSLDGTNLVIYVQTFAGAAVASTSMTVQWSAFG